MTVRFIGMLLLGKTWGEVVSPRARRFELVRFYPDHFCSQPWL